MKQKLFIFEEKELLKLKKYRLLEHSNSKNIRYLCWIWNTVIPKTLEWDKSGKVLDMGQELSDRTNLVVVDGFIRKTFKTKDLR